MKAAGYATFFAGKWHLGPEGCWPENQGFDINMGGIDRGGPYGGKQYFSPYGNPRLADGPPGEHLPDRLATETAKFIEANTDRPFFAYLSFYSVHTPLMAREDLQAEVRGEARSGSGSKPSWGREGERDVRLVQEHAVYAGMVEAMDLAVGKVLAKLDELGLRDNTHRHLHLRQRRPLDQRRLADLEPAAARRQRLALRRRHPRAAARALARHGEAPASVIDTPVSQPGFLPHAARARRRAAAARTRPSTASASCPSSAARNRSPERPLFWHYPHYGNQGGAPGAAIRRGDWKLIEWFEDGRVELFNLAQDLGEKNDLAAQRTRARPAAPRRAPRLAERGRREAADAESEIRCRKAERPGCETPRGEESSGWQGLKAGAR